MTNTKDQYQNLDLGLSQPVGIKTEIVKVSVSADDIMKEYCDAFIMEAIRKAPLIMARDDALKSEELFEYAKFLLTERIKSVNLNCPNWRKLKALWIPSFIQYMLSCIGECVDNSRGLKFIPVDSNPSAKDFEWAKMISDKIFQFNDYLQMVRDAMPRGVTGDFEVMSCAIIAEYVRGIDKVNQISEFMAAFINAKLVQEADWKAIYRVMYDDVDYIRSALAARREALL